MKVVSWTRKLTFSQSSSPARSRLRKSVSSLSRLLSPGRRRERRRTESALLLPLRITLDSPGQVRVRRDSLCHRAEIRLILQQRVSQRIRERSMAAVIREARTQLQRETASEDVYVPLDFVRERRTFQEREVQEEVEEELYITMS